MAEGQHEIDFQFGDVMLSADRVMTFKHVVKTYAAKHGLHATFMPKPIYGINGSGMHTNMSLYYLKDGKNAFDDPTARWVCPRPLIISLQVLWPIFAALQRSPTPP